jgi:hypothetical protein
MEKVCKELQTVRKNMKVPDQYPKVFDLNELKQ